MATFAFSNKINQVVENMLCQAQWDLVAFNNVAVNLSVTSKCALSTSPSLSCCWDQGIQVWLGKPAGRGWKPHVNGKQCLHLENAAGEVFK